MQFNGDCYRAVQVVGCRRLCKSSLEVVFGFRMRRSSVIVDVHVIRFYAYTGGICSARYWHRVVVLSKHYLVAEASSLVNLVVGGNFRNGWAKRKV